MLQEIEQKVTSMSDSSSGTKNLNLKQDQGVQGGLVSAGSDQESAELLASKLELLKTNLVSFQHLLEERHGEERMTPALQDPVNYSPNYIVHYTGSIGIAKVNYDSVVCTRPGNTLLTI